MKRTGAIHVVTDVPFQFCLISAAAVSIMPTTILLPGFNHTLVFIAERMSLGVGICVCALLAAARPRAFQQYAMAFVALIFFGFLYRDERILNAAEDRIDGLMSLAPVRAHVVNGIGRPAGPLQRQ
jgi:hypothetical protein